MYGAFSDASLRIFELAKSGESGTVHQSRAAYLGSLALSSCCLVESDKLVLAGSWDNCMYLYSMEYGRVILKKEAHKAAVSAVCLHGQTVLSASWDSLVKVWTLGTDEPTNCSLELKMTLAAHDSEVVCLALEPGCRWAASGGIDGTGCVWCIDMERTGERGCLAGLMAPHDAPVTALAWTDDGCFLASAAEDETVRLYRVLSTGIGGEATVLMIVEHEPSALDELGHKIVFVVRTLRFVGDQLIAAGDNGAVAMWEIKRTKECALEQLEVEDGGLGTRRCAPPQALALQTDYSSRTGHNGSLQLELGRWPVYLTGRAGLPSEDGKVRAVVGSKSASTIVTIGDAGVFVWTAAGQ